jgi:hypothetical protein
MTRANYTSYVFAALEGKPRAQGDLHAYWGTSMPGSGGTAPTSRLAAVQSQSGGIAVSPADEAHIDLLMGSVYCAWEMSTHEEAQRALRWARRKVAQSRLAFASIDETTYVLGGQYLQALISGRRGTPAA